MFTKSVFGFIFVCVVDLFLSPASKRKGEKNKLEEAMGKLSVPLDRINMGSAGRFLFLYFIHTYIFMDDRFRAPCVVY